MPSYQPSLSMESEITAGAALLSAGVTGTLEEQVMLDLGSARGGRRHPGVGSTARTASPLTGGVQGPSATTGAPRRASGPWTWMLSLLSACRPGEARRGASLTPT